MDPKFIKLMKERLIKEKEHLEKELSQFAHRNQKATLTDFDADFPNMGNGEDENAAEVAQFGDNLSLENSLEKSLRDAEDALGRMEAGTYGICKYCKVEISQERLEARPASSSCIACKKTLTQEI